MEIEIRKRDLEGDMVKAIAVGWSDDLEVLFAIAEVVPGVVFYRNAGGKRVEYSSDEMLTADRRGIEVR